VSRRLTAILVVLLLLRAGALAADITGTVTDGTTGKPAAGVEVTLLKLAGGMDEAGSTKTDAQGRYSLKSDDAQTPHMVRVVYQGVNYMQPVPPGGATGDVTIYDASAKRFDGIKVVAHVMRLQAQGNEIQVAELYALQNTSSPPRTWMGDRTFGLYLPKGAQIDSADAAGPGGMPLRTDVSPAGAPNQYAFSFPIRPGENKLQLNYRLPYTGQMRFDPRTLDPTQHLVVMLPKSMTFAPGDGAQFQPLTEEQNATVMVASNVAPGQALPFTVSGTGLIQQDQTQTATAGGGPMQAQPDDRPGGGLGRPEDTPDPLSQYRWPILIALGVALLLGGVYVVKRPAPQPVFEAAGAPAAVPAHAIPSVPARSSEKLLEALKEELFELEMERQQGRISQADYEKSKAALDQTLARAVSRRQGQGTV